MIDYLREENGLLRAGFRGKRRKLSEDDRCRLAGASAIKCCYAAAGSGSGAEESGLRAPVRRKTSIRDHKRIVVAKKMSRKVSRRVVRSACIAEFGSHVRISELRAVGRSCNSNGATPGAHRASPSSERGKAFVSKGMPSFAGWSDLTAR